MQIEVIKKLNPNTQIKVTAEEKTLAEALLQVTPFIQMRGICGLCGNEDVSLQARLAGDNQEYTYMELVCRECWAKQGLGEYKKGGYFLKKWERYEKHKS